MVFCSKCGTKSEDSAKYCGKCGAKLGASTEKSVWNRFDEGGEEIGKRFEEWGEDFGKRAEAWGEDFSKHAEEECFGLANFGIIFGLIIGLMIIVVGVTSLIGIDVEFWAWIIVTFGLLILGGSIYSLTKKR
jgi:hypothetical protein